MTENFVQDGLQFFVNLFENLRTGILFFGGPFEIFIAILDITITTLVIYFVLRLIRDSRAWQLLKGIVLIVIFSQIFIIMGLQTIGFILTNTLSVLTIAFVVLFQPELRRALETVGRNSFTLISGVVAQDTPIGKNAIYSMIESIVIAVERLAKSHTGALIIIERETKLGEITEQDNAVIMDSAVSSTLLLQIFYKGSPLHDGAVLIRNGRINAARCHVPLSDNYHLRKDFGTRHRAAIGVSEMGDAIAVVVSEERSVISVAIDGRLYTLDNEDALRTILHKQLDKEQQGVFSTLIKNTKKKRFFNLNKNILNEDCNNNNVSLNQKDDFKSNNSSSFLHNSITKEKRRKKVLMILGSFMVSLFIWLYVQITVNPVETKSFSVPVTIEGNDILKSNHLEFEAPSNNVSLSIKGRTKNLENLNSNDILAIIDVSEIKTSSTKLLPVTIKIKKLSYFRTTIVYPSSISIKFSIFDENAVTPTPVNTIAPSPTIMTFSSISSSLSSSVSSTTTSK